MSISTITPTFDDPDGDFRAWETQLSDDGRGGFIENHPADPDGFDRQAPRRLRSKRLRQEGAQVISNGRGYRRHRTGEREI